MNSAVEWLEKEFDKLQAEHAYEALTIWGYIIYGVYHPLSSEDERNPPPMISIKEQ